MDDYKHYMQLYGTSDDMSQPIKDLERDFVGLKYKEATGLDAKGKPKNIYFEEYADSDEVRAYIPESICREATEVKLTFVFLGTERRKIFNDFYEYVKVGKHKYWDNVRKKMVYIVLNGEVKPSSDILIGDKPYIIATFPFKNLYGQSFDVEE